MDRRFVGYEYKEIISDKEKMSFMIDCYECFGWELDNNYTSSPVNAHGPSPKIVLGMKRDRKIMNKMELTRLQRNFESCVKEIGMLEQAKTSGATMWALIIGFMGTAFMAGSVFAVTADPPRIFLCILLAIPAFAGWILPLFVYRKIVQEKTEKMIPLIEEKYEEIYEICEKGNKLLA